DEGDVAVLRFQPPPGPGVVDGPPGLGVAVLDESRVVLLGVDHRIAEQEGPADNDRPGHDGSGHLHGVGSLSALVSMFRADVSMFRAEVRMLPRSPLINCTRAM